jgi:DNA-binding CsgD family transcriptional regulator
VHGGLRSYDLGVGGGWPFAGRVAELAQVRHAIEAGPGIVLIGPAGVGKTRLAVEAAASRSSRGLRLNAVHIAGSEAAARPFGAFAHEMPRELPGVDGTANVLRLAAEHLRGNHPDDPLLVVDDAHLLDQQSAALVHYLVRAQRCRALLTVRAGEHVLDAVSDLWRAGDLSTLELGPLGESATRAVLAGALGGAIEPATAHRLWDASRGNVLYLRELVTTGRATGVLSLVDGAWRWIGELAVSATLRDLVRARIGRLSRAERDALELVALGEPLGVDVLLALAGASALRGLEERGLLATKTAGRRHLVRTAHPLFREVVRSACGSLRTRLRLRALADAVEATGARRRDDVLQVALWRLDSGAPARPETLMAAAGVAWSSYDIELATRLFRAALDAGAGLAAAAPLGFNLWHLGRSAEAVPLLQSVVGEARTDQDRIDLVRGLGISLSCGLGRYDDAQRVIDELSTPVTDPSSHQSIATTRAVVDFYAGRPGPALRTLEHARALGPMTGRPETEAGAIEAWCLAYGGQTRRSLDLIRAMLDKQESWRELAGYVRPTLVDARCNAHLFAGELAAAEASALEGLEVCGHATGWEQVIVAMTAYRAQALRMRGDVATAEQLCRDVVRRSSWHSNMPRCLSELAHSAALLGDVPRARLAIEEAQRGLHAGLGNFALAVAANAPWVAVAAGDLDRALHDLNEAAQRAQAAQLYGYQLLALHDVVRISPVGRADQARDHLRRLVSRMDGDLVGLCLRHAEASSTMDSVALLEVSHAFEAAGMLLYAAECAAQAAQALGRTGRPAAAQVRAWTLARHCPGVRTPALDRLAAPALTPRQLHIVQGVVSGLTCKEIAEGMRLSVRTVENHLAVAYHRLGVHDREELAAVLQAPLARGDRERQ